MTDPDAEFILEDSDAFPFDIDNGITVSMMDGAAPFTGSDSIAQCEVIVIDIIDGVGLGIRLLGLKMGKSNAPAGLKPLKKLLVGVKQVTVFGLQRLCVHVFEKGKLNSATA